MPQIKLLCIDLQKEFSAPGGKHYKKRPGVDFIKHVLVPYLKKRDLKVAEIISDYRQPRPGDLDDSTRPGEEGYKSELSLEVKQFPVWVKCMNSPLWTRENIGDPLEEPGVPYQDPLSLTNWLTKVIGLPGEVDVVLIGLTLDCCVLSTAQELCFRGYKVIILEEGVDTYSGDSEEKEWILRHVPLLNWASSIRWEDLKTRLETIG